MTKLLYFVFVGFLAQIVDGALGMAYGVTSTTILLGLGCPPAVASASVHTAEVFTTLVSGTSHLKLGNVSNMLFKKLVVPGVLGGIVGAYLLTMAGDILKPFVAMYLLFTGGLILARAAGWLEIQGISQGRLIPLGLLGGFFDAVGGGGWGPIVTSTLMADGQEPRKVIGSVNLAEFFVTLAEAATFFVMLRVVEAEVIVGLLIGGVLAAPLAALVCKRLPAKILMWLVGILIMGLSLRTLILAMR